MLKKLLLYLLLALVLFVGYLFVNLLGFQSKQQSFDPIERTPVPEAVIERFSSAIQIPTISPEDSADFNKQAFEQFASFLEATFPLSDSLLNKQVFNNYSFLYQWSGTDASLKPVILMGHYDVVPVIESNLPEWKQPPFSGAVVNDTIWGRGTLDDKISVIGILEAVESLLKEDFAPERTIYLAFGHDEEIGGINGALAIVEHLKKQGVEAAYTLDEGGVITSGIVPGLSGDVALIGIAEKGFVTLELSVDVEGGHSSMPEAETSIDILSKAIYELKANPFPTKFTPPLHAFFDYLGPEMGLTNKLVFANRKVFGGVIKGIYSQTNTGNANIRTTTSPTIFNSGVKENIIPKKASATVNFRILPGESIESVIIRVRKGINDDRISITEGDFASEASEVSSTEAFGFQMIHQTIKEIYPESIVSPNLVIGATDSRYFRAVSEQVYRFLPARITPDNINGIHGINERIGVEEYKDAIRFYMQLIRNSGKGIR